MKIYLTVQFFFLAYILAEYFYTLNGSLNSKQGSVISFILFRLCLIFDIVPITITKVVNHRDWQYTSDPPAPYENIFIHKFYSEVESLLLRDIGLISLAVRTAYDWNTTDYINVFATFKVVAMPELSIKYTVHKGFIRQDLFMTACRVARAILIKKVEALLVSEDEWVKVGYQNYLYKENAT